MKRAQALLRELVYAVLPLGKGIVVDPFMGSGSTVAAAEALGIHCIGIETNIEYFHAAKKSIGRLSRVVVPRDQTSFALT